MTISRKYIFAALTIASISCSTHRKDTSIADTSQASTETVHAISLGTNSHKYIPNAIIYQTNGDYNKYLSVNLTADGKAIASYPAITDVSTASEPYELGDGWLLDRRGGIGTNTAFVDYTYAEYSALKSQPSANTIYSKIIPDARVTRYVQLPINVNEAISNPEAVKKYIPK